MSGSTSSGQMSQNATDQDTHGDPPSLRRRAPVRIDMTLRSGEPMTMASGKVHLVAGKVFVIQVVSPTSTAKVEIAAEPPLLTIVPASRIEGGALPAYLAEFSASLRFRLPLPAMARLHVTILDGHPTPCRITIPVKVWPAFSMWILWWLLAFLGIVGLRWERIVARSELFSDILSAIWADCPFLLMVLLTGTLIVIPLRIIGWLVSLAETSEGE